MNLLVRRLHLLRPSLQLFLYKTPFVSSKFSTFDAEAPPPKPHFSAPDYLIQSCGLSSEEALQASKKIDHLKVPNKPDTVLRFLRETGIDESDIRTAVLRDSRILCSSVDNNWSPNIEKLKEVGFPNSDISSLISRYPRMFLFNIVSSIDFWMRTLGSLENLSVVLRMSPRVLSSSMDKVIVPNLSFLQKELDLDVCQIVRLIRLAPFLITSSPEALIVKAKEAEELGVNRSSRTFVYALSLVSCLNRKTIDARVNNLRSCGFSREEVTTLVSKHPYILKVTEELMGRKVEFLIKEVGCDKLHVICNPSLFTYSLDKRLIPRNLVRNLLELKGLLVGNRKFFSIAMLTEKQFVEKFVLPHEHAIPGLHQAYADACTGNIRGIEWFKSISS